MLNSTPQIQMVGFERDYSYDIVSHKIDRSRCHILDVTELTNHDIQEIFSRIPTEMRADRSFRRPTTEEGVVPSIYEFVEVNIGRPALGARFISVLEELKRESLSLHGLLVMICYVHSCRTPASLDMALAFLRNQVTDYTELYALARRLGALLAEYSGALVDSDQDHFITRSTIVSEAVMKAVAPPDLKRMLLQFHREVSSYRICRYDVFKRKAFDEKVVTQAFKNWEEGKEFYELMYARDESPYLLQQGALYLAHRRRFREAFVWIDTAVEKSQSRIPSIRNSHAIILFRANIGAASDDATVRKTLKQSMDILSELYKFDKRKTYHVLVFADQAVQYWDVYSDDIAKGFLITAKAWLAEEHEQSPWHRGIKRLLGTVNNKLLEAGVRP